MDGAKGTSGKITERLVDYQQASGVVNRRTGLLT
jgi:hypothetical protein